MSIQLMNSFEGWLQKLIIKNVIYNYLKVGSDNLYFPLMINVHKQGNVLNVSLRSLNLHYDHQNCYETH